MLIAQYLGEWESYSPETQAGIVGVIYCRRKTDLIDFYENRDILDGSAVNFTAVREGDYYVIKSVSRGSAPCMPAGLHWFKLDVWADDYTELIKYRVNADTFEIEAVPEAATSVDRVSARQFKLQLFNMGLMDTVEEWVSTQPRDIQLAYENSATFERGDAMMQAGFNALGFTEEQLVDFFEAASNI